MMTSQKFTHLDELPPLIRRLRLCSILGGLAATCLTTVAAVRYHTDQPILVPVGLAAASSLVAITLFLLYIRAKRPIEMYESRQTALRRSFTEVRKSCSDHVEELFQSSPASRADKAITDKLRTLKEFKDRDDARWARASWWDQFFHRPVSTDLEDNISQLEKAKERLKAGSLAKARAFFDDIDELAQRRIDALELSAIKSVPQSHLKPYDDKAIALNALLFSAMSVPVSAWNDLSQAGNIYDTLREVNGNYAGMSDFEIWLNTLVMPGESLAGLVSLTKGAYFEHLVEADFQGERFEHFNHPDTDIVIDGVAYQIKATDSASYVESVADGIPVISTSEVAEFTGAIDGGYSDEYLEKSVELALGGSVIDVQDTAVDAILTGLGGLGIVAMIRGASHALNSHQKGGDVEVAVLEGVGIAVTGTLKGFVNTGELGYKALKSGPSRFVGRQMVKVAGAAIRKIG